MSLGAQVVREKLTIGTEEELLLLLLVVLMEQGITLVSTETSFSRKYTNKTLASLLM
jgi:hypothetical protein